MANENAVSNEEIVAAIMKSRTMKEAAALVGISQRALYDRMNLPEFVAMYNAAKSDVVRNALKDLNSRTETAIDTIADIMQNEGVNPATRLQAAQALLNAAGKFAERLSKDEETIAESVRDPFTFYI